VLTGRLEFCRQQPPRGTPGAAILIFRFWVRARIAIKKTWRLALQSGCGFAFAGNASASKKALHAHSLDLRGLRSRGAASRCLGRGTTKTVVVLDPLREVAHSRRRTGHARARARDPPSQARLFQNGKIDIKWSEFMDLMHSAIGVFRA
jgi:hypothetical protein